MEENIYMLADTEICRRIGLKVRSLRLRQNFTQESLAALAQISVSTVKRIEEGEIRSFDSLMRVLRVLGELDIFSPLIREEQMSPNEYYEFTQAAQKKQRRRASSKNINRQTKDYESEW